MRESVRSLRIYLFLSGTLATLYNADAVISAELSGIDRVVALFSTLSGGAILYAAFQIRTLLVEAPDRVIAILYFAIGSVLFRAASVAAAFGIGAAISVNLIPLLILFYLKRNVVRLASEESSDLESVAA